MTIKNAEVGWGIEAKLLREILKMLERLLRVTSNNAPLEDACCEECNSWGTLVIEGEGYTFPIGNINSITIIVEEGTVVISNGFDSSELTQGMSVDLTATTVLEQPVMVDASSGKAVCVYLYCSGITTTTSTTILN